MRITITDEEAREIYKLLRSEYNSLPEGFYDKPVVSMGRNRLKMLAKKLGYSLPNGKDKTTEA